MWSSAAEAHLLQDLVSCVFRDVLLHSFDVTSGHLSYCCLPIKKVWPLASPRHFHPENAAHWISSLFWTVLCKPKISVDQQFQTILQPAPLALIPGTTFKVSWIPFLPHSNAQFDLLPVILTASTCLNAMSCCLLIGSLDIYINKQLAGECSQHFTCLNFLNGLKPSRVREIVSH